MIMCLLLLIFRCARKFPPLFLSFLLFDVSRERAKEFVCARARERNSICENLSDA
jgi:hypothetical protein